MYIGTSGPSRHKQKMQANFDSLLRDAPATILRAKREAVLLLSELKVYKGPIVVGGETVLDDVRLLVDDAESTLGFLEGGMGACVGEDGRLSFEKHKAKQNFTIGMICEWQNGLSSLGSCKKWGVLRDPSLDKSYSKYPDLNRKVRLCVAPDCNTLERPAEEDKEAYTILHLLSLLSFCLMELQAQYVTWARLVHHNIRGKDSTNVLMIKFLKRNKREVGDLHATHADLSNHEDHMNPPGKSDPSGSGVRYMRDVPTCFMKRQPSNYFAEVEAIQDKRISGCEVTSEEYRKWLTSVEFVFADGPRGNKDESPEAILAFENGWKLVFSEYKAYYMKKKKVANEPLPVDAHDLKVEEHIDPRAFSAAYSSEHPPAQIVHVMSDGKTGLKVALKNGVEPAHIGEIQRVVNEDLGETGGSIIALAAETNNHEVRSYHNIKKHMGLVTARHLYKMRCTGPNPVGPMVMAGNNPSNLRKCMNPHVERYDPSGNRKYVATLGQQVERSADMYGEPAAPETVDPIKRGLEEMEEPDGKRQCIQ